MTITLVPSTPRFGGGKTEPVLPDGAGLTMGLRPPGEASPFSPFVRHVEPSPLPDKWQFYTENLRKEFPRSYVNGGLIYAKNVSKNPLKLSALLGLSTVFGVMHAAFHHTKLQPFLHLSFLTSLLIYPILKANQIFPYFSKSYDLTQEGNPEQGKKLFQAALDESMYTIGNVYLKPITIAMLLSYLISLPLIIRDPRGLTQRLIKNVVVGITEHPPISFLRQRGERINKSMPEFMKLWHQWTKLDLRLVNFGSEQAKRLPEGLRSTLESFYTDPKPPRVRIKA